MQEITVFRWDYDKNTKVPIGVVLERRKTERGSNYIDLLRLARRLFALDTADAVHVLIDVGQGRQAYLPEMNSGCSAG
jgi:hypothetical protein